MTSPEKKNNNKAKVRRVITKSKHVRTKKNNLAPLRKSTRTRILTAKAAGLVRYLEGPTYVAADDPRAGGKHSSVVLGPDGLSEMGSDANSNLPSAITAVRKRYPASTFYAGHVLNADLGGNGQNAANMTVLISTANSANKNFDNRIKEAVNSLDKAYTLLRLAGIGVNGYGVRVDVRTEATTWGPDYPDNCVTTGLILQAAVVHEPDVEDTPANQGVIDKMDEVQNFVAAANQHTSIKNPKPAG
jgi:hypothetical protein